MSRQATRNHPERLFRDMDRYGNRHRDDLSADHVIQLPTKPVVSSVKLDHSGGALSGVLWHSRQLTLLTLIGRARKSAVPVGDSRVLMNSVCVGFPRNWLTTSLSQSVARSRGFVGLSVASL